MRTHKEELVSSTCKRGDNENAQKSGGTFSVISLNHSVHTQAHPDSRTHGSYPLMYTLTHSCIHARVCIDEHTNWHTDSLHTFTYSTDSLTALTHLLSHSLTLSLSLSHTHTHTYSFIHSLTHTHTHCIV